MLENFLPQKMYSIVPPELVWGIALGLIRKCVDGDRVSPQILKSPFALTVGTVGVAHSECFTFSMISSPTGFSKASSYLNRIANGTTRALVNTGLSSLAGNVTWIPLRFASELEPNKSGYC